MHKRLARCVTRSGNDGARLRGVEPFTEGLQLWELGNDVPCHCLSAVTAVARKHGTDDGLRSAEL